MYSPQGSSIKSGQHVWRGETRAGMLVDLYTTEWINPRPELTVKSVILASPYMKTVADPILIGMTAVRLAKRPAPAATEPAWMDRRPLERLNPPKIAGVPLDLGGGEIVDFGLYVAPDGTEITAPNMGSRNEKPKSAGNTEGCEVFHAGIDLMLCDNNEYIGRPVTFTFKTPRVLSGIGAVGGYRLEIYNNDFAPSISPKPLLFEVSDDGKTFRTVGQVEKHNPESEGMFFVPLDPAPIKAVRVSGPNLTRVQLYVPAK
jgi:hypothetical protein